MHKYKHESKLNFKFHFLSAFKTNWLFFPRFIIKVRNIHIILECEAKDLADLEKELQRLARNSFSAKDWLRISYEIEPSYIPNRFTINIDLKAPLTSTRSFSNVAELREFILKKFALIDKLAAKTLTRHEILARVGGSFDGQPIEPRIKILKLYCLDLIKELLDKENSRKKNQLHPISEHDFYFFIPRNMQGQEEKPLYEFDAYLGKTCAGVEIVTDKYSVDYVISHKMQKKAAELFLSKDDLITYYNANHSNNPSVGASTSQKKPPV